MAMKLCIIVAGPDGAGKSTPANEFIPERIVWVGEHAQRQTSSEANRRATGGMQAIGGHV